MKRSITAITMILMSHAWAQSPPPSNAPIREQLEWQQREIQRMQDDQHRAKLAADRAAAIAESQGIAANRAADKEAATAQETAAAKEAAEIEKWLYYPDEELDASVARYFAKIDADRVLRQAARTRLKQDYQWEIAKLKKEKVMRQRQLMEVESQKLEVERQRLEIEILRAKLADDAKEKAARK
jgi:hypothetical protein